MPGVYGRGGDFEEVRERVAALVTRASAAEEPEQMRFPPILPRHDLETVGYLKSFPHLAGSIFSFEGTEAQAPSSTSAPAATRTGASSRT